MTAPVVTLRKYTGTNAGTESAALDGIALMSIDSAANDPTAHKIAAGTNSFESWLRVKVDTAAGKTFSAFWFERAGTLPDGAVIKAGITATAATPTAAKSTVAVETVQDGRHYIFDVGEYDTDGAATAYLVLQAQVAATAASGDIGQQVFTVGYSQA